MKNVRADDRTVELVIIASYVEADSWHSIEMTSCLRYL